MLCLCLVRYLGNVAESTSSCSLLNHHHSPSQQYVTHDSRDSILTGVRRNKSAKIVYSLFSCL
eukprot:m.106777 g.106777  ORF g.106777 m.106777 type:complete len:63 (+) comp27752_c0_seq1:206-394(+)